MKIVIAGGGTGGHVYPAIAICQGLRRRYPTAQFIYIGTRHGLESQLLPAHPWIRFRPICAAGWPRRSRIRKIPAALRLVMGVGQSMALLLWYRPRLVVGVGGYASLAPVWIASLAGRVLPVRTVIHEQNVVGGKANRWLSRFVDLVMLSFAETERSFPHARKTAVTGNPIREEFLHVKKTDDAYRSLGLDPQRRTILVFGGSKGASQLTEQVIAGRQEVAGNPDLQILLIVGDSDRARAIRAQLSSERIHNIVVRAYVHHMGAAFAVADLVVCRAGATSLAEITACGKASVLVPWEHAVEDHQRRNAEALLQQSACAMADENEMVCRGLVEVILEQIQDELGLAKLAANAGRLGRRRADTRILGEIECLMRGG